MSTQPKLPTTIGSKELVDFPDLRISKVPAKVDTGADSSSIWASSIREKRGTLYYVLFDRQSPFYTGQTVSTRHFSITYVRSSFGQTELRYKVKLKTVMAGRTIQANFTLANRANNRLPVLIGRRTLHGKYIVDVSRHKGEDQPELLMLVSTHDYPIIQKFVNRLQSADSKVHITIAAYSDLDFTVGNKITKIVLKEAERDVASFDMVYFKSVSHRVPTKDITAAVAQYLHKRGVPFMDQAASTLQSGSKLYQYIVLNDNNIATPLSIFVSANRLKDSYKRFTKTLGLPFIIKDVNGSKGRQNYLISNETIFNRVCREVDKKQLSVIAQTYIENDGDYRILIFGQKIALVIHRQRTDSKTHLNNTSRGGVAQLVSRTELPGVVQRWSILATKLLKREVAGVDVVRDKQTDSWYCLEVNEGPQIATGSFVPEKQQAFAEFINKELRR